MTDPDRRAIAALHEVGGAFADARVRGLVLSEPFGFPHVDLLLARGQARAAAAALARVGWRWRIGGDGHWRIVPRRRYTFEGGFVLTVHAALPTSPLPAVALRELERALWAGARWCDDGLLRTEDAPLAVHAAVQVARGSLRSHAQREELAARARAAADDALALARAAGVEKELRAVVDLPSHPVAHAGTGAALRAAGWRAARGLRRAPRRGPVLALLGEPWDVAPTRCRFDGLELLAGPGTFLPRAPSERLVRAAAERLAGFIDPVVVDVGTGCGAMALALARRIGTARVLGVDLDEGALVWARRNADRLGLPHVEFARGGLLDPLPKALRGRVSVIVANVPCVPPGAVEPALDAPPTAYAGTGDDGLGLQRALAEQARAVLRPDGRLFVQLVPAQWEAYRETLHAAGFDELEDVGGSIAAIASARWPGA